MIYIGDYNSDVFGNDILNYRNRSFPNIHLHQRAELIWVEEGSLTLYCNRDVFSMERNSFGLILPNQLHCFRASEQASFWVHTFSPSQVPAFFSAVGTRSVQTPVFQCEDQIRDYYISLCLRRPAWVDPIDSNSRCIQSDLPDGIPGLKLKAALYGVLACFLEQAQFTERSGGDDTLFLQVISYIAEHFQEDLTLTSVSRAFGYEPHYFCRCMKNAADVPFRQLVNSYRLDRARELLENTDMQIAQIAMECGFGSLRTFNRVFQQAEQIEPRKYRSSFRFVGV